MKNVKTETIVRTVILIDIIQFFENIEIIAILF